MTEGGDDDDEEERIMNNVGEGEGHEADYSEFSERFDDKLNGEDEEDDEDEEDEDKDDRNRGAEDPTEEVFDDTGFSSADVVDLSDADITDDDEEEAEGEGQDNNGPNNDGGMGV